MLLTLTDQRSKVSYAPIQWSVPIVPPAHILKDTAVDLRYPIFGIVQSWEEEWVVHEERACIVHRSPHQPAVAGQHSTAAWSWSVAALLQNRVNISLSSPLFKTIFQEINQHAFNMVHDKTCEAEWIYAILCASMLVYDVVLSATEGCIRGTDSASNPWLYDLYILLVKKICDKSSMNCQNRANWYWLGLLNVIAV